MCRAGIGEVGFSLAPPAALVDLVFQIKCLVRDRPARGVRGDSCLLMRILLVMEGDGCGGEARRRGDGGQQAVSK